MEQRTVESFMFSKGKKGDTFYSRKKDTDITPIARYYGRNITTETVTVVEGERKSPLAVALTKVTLI
jgi:hypothetical protein